MHIYIYTHDIVSLPSPSITRTLVHVPSFGTSSLRQLPYCLLSFGSIRKPVLGSRALISALGLCGVMVSENASSLHEMVQVYVGFVLSLSRWHFA